MPYRFDSTLKHQQYMPSIEWIDEPEYQPGEYRKLQDAWYAEHGVFPSRSNPATNGTKAKLVSKHKSVCDYFGSLGGHCCSQAFKDLVDELEPDVHEFRPFTLYDQNDTQIGGRFYQFSMLQVVDSLIPEQSTIKYRKHKNVDVYSWAISEPPIREHFTLDSNSIRDKHLWWDNKTAILLRFCSDEFHDEFQKRELKFLEFLPVSTA